MWTRARIKTEAKKVLRERGYWMPLLITFLAGILAGGFGTSGSGFGTTLTTEYTYEYTEDLTPAGFAAFFDEFFGEIGMMLDNFFTNPLIAMTTIFVIALAFIIGLAFGFAWVAFIGGPVIVGKNRFFMEHRAFGSKFTRLFYGFTCGSYINVVKIMFLRELKIFLWSLLFIIPGIIKSYEYCMVPYILAENPDISSEKAFAISKQMTKGEKWKIFMLELSFIGWIILGTLCCCVGVYFLEPYYEATRAELYQVMREKAHGLGFADYNELPGFFPERT